MKRWLNKYCGEVVTAIVVPSVICSMVGVAICSAPLMLVGFCGMFSLVALIGIVC